MKAYRIISADSHAIEPPDLWQKYLPAPYAGRGPRVAAGAAGDEWVCEGLPRRAARRPMGAVARDEVKARAAAAQGSQRYDADPGAWDPDRRVDYMRRDGVDAEVLYPNYAMRLFAIPDPALQWYTCVAYNDWLADFCRAHPAELLGIAVIPALDSDRAIKEARRAKERGMVGVLLPQDTPDGSRYSHPKWDALLGDPGRDGAAGEPAHHRLRPRQHQLGEGRDRRGRTPAWPTRSFPCAWRAPSARSSWRASSTATRDCSSCRRRTSCRGPQVSCAVSTGDTTARRCRATR